jgi:hypothetical protein
MVSLFCSRDTAVIPAKKDPPGSGVVLRLDVAGREKKGLLDRDLTKLFGHSQDKVDSLEDPGVRDLVDILARRLAQSIPEGLSLGITIGLGLEVIRDTSKGTFRRQDDRPACG